MRFRHGWWLSAGLALGAACGHDSPEACFEPNAHSYPFHWPTDSTKWFRWPASYYPVRVYAEPVGALPANADTAMLLWLGAFRCGELSLTRITDSTRADIVVRNPPLQPLARPAGVMLAFDSINACAGRTDVALDSLDRLERPVRSYLWPVGADSAASAACYRFVSAHELGHALGLFMHSTDTADLMYSRPRRRALSADDRYTIQVLYNITPTLEPQPR